MVHGLPPDPATEPDLVSTPLANPLQGGSTAWLSSLPILFADQEPPAEDAAATEALKPHALFSPLFEGRHILRRGRPTILGRDRTCTIVLPSNHVSRKHAEIRWDGDGFSIFDLGSTNGTRVDGVRVTRRRRLRDEARIEVGPFIMAMKILDSPDAEIDSARIFDLDPTQTHELFAGDLAGNLQNVPAGEMLRFLERARRTGCLHFQFPDGEGCVYVRRGEVIHAEFGGEQGPASAIALFSRREGRFRFANELVACPRSIRASISYLLEQAAKGQ